ncbi:hypothetical protein ABZ897_51165 [Nonomuraea sp. NPDC046802]|uniref:hypothetical protein n=1 Tax=Nonomuraea sp. NPDC046802 TaxID=3154919 RepID=UPI0033DDE557
MAKPYGLIITEDHLTTTPEDSRANAFVVTANADLATHIQLTHRLKAGEGTQFRLFDGDGNLDYAGRIIVPPGEEGGELWLAPLDWAKTDTGSAEIRYLNTNTGQWDVL